MRVDSSFAVAIAIAVAGSANAEPLPQQNPYAADVMAALADARKLPPEVASYTLYLTLRPCYDRDEQRKVCDLWTNALSREAELVRPRRIGQNLLAINTLDYGWDHDSLLAALALEDCYYHVSVLVEANTAHKCYFSRTKGFKAGWYDAQIITKKRVAALAPWLPATETAELVALTNSPAPILRADWWFARAAIQADRAGTGYYDHLQLKTLADFDKLCEFDRKKSQGIKQEVAAIVARSGVSNFPRQVFREQALTGGRWETRDQIADNRDEKNALRQLNGDLKPAAFELYCFLPNGLLATFLADGKGARQDSAPDGVGHDSTAPGRDGKIHVGLSCIRCHAEGLRPIDDWARKVYAGGLQLNSPDYDKARRLAQIYLGDLQGRLDDDRSRYAKTLFSLTSWKTADAAKAVGRAWAAYTEANLLPKDLAAELGLPEVDYLKNLRAYYAANQLGDAVLASHLADPPLPIRRDDAEQLYPIVANVILGGSK